MYDYGLSRGDGTSRGGGWAVERNEGGNGGWETVCGSVDRCVGVLNVILSRTDRYTDLLRTTETFIPRVKPFRPNDPSRTDDDPASGLAGFATLKRDLVQLAGLLANDDTPTQDIIRECGGMQVILSMCVTDDRNPRTSPSLVTIHLRAYGMLTVIREYALLAVRNLMINNVANQAIIKEMDPLGVVGPDGELREMPARMGVGK